MKDAFFLLALLLFQSICVNAVPEPAFTTKYYEHDGETTVEAWTRLRTTYPAYVEEYYHEVLPTGVPTSILSTFGTYTDRSVYPYVTELHIILPSGDAPRVSTTYTYPTYTYSAWTRPAQTTYVVPITYTAFESCSQTWTHITTISLNRFDAADVKDKTVVIISTLLSESTPYFDATPITVTDYVALVSPTDVPKAILSSTSSELEPWGMEFCWQPTEICSTPTAAATATKKEEPSCRTTFTYDPKSKYPGLVSGSGSSTDINGSYAKSKENSTSTPAPEEVAKPESVAGSMRVLDAWWIASGLMIAVLLVL